MIGIWFTSTVLFPASISEVLAKQTNLGLQVKTFLQKKVEAVSLSQICIVNYLMFIFVLYVFFVFFIQCSFFFFSFLIFALNYAMNAFATMRVQGLRALFM